MMRVFIERQTFEGWIQSVKLPDGFIVDKAHTEDELGIWRWIKIFKRSRPWQTALVYEITKNSILVHGAENLEFANELIRKFFELTHQTVTIEVAEKD